MQTPAYLFVASLLYNGWFVAPPSEHPTMRICEKMLRETERGLIGDAVVGKTKCTSDPSFKFDLDPDERAEGDDWMGTSEMGEQHKVRLDQ